MFEPLKILEGRMYIAGEGTNSRYAGFIHGAMFSGIETAEAIEQRISSGFRLMANGVLVLLMAGCHVYLT